MSGRSRKLFTVGRVLALVVVGLVAFAAYVGWRAYQVNGDLNAAVTDAASLESALRAGDDDATTAALDGLSGHAGHAADITGGPSWAILGHLPVVGDDVRGVRAVSVAINDLSGDDGLRPLVTSSGTLDGLLPQGGAVDLDSLAALEPVVSTGAAALKRADSQLAAEDPDGFVTQLASKYRDLQDRVSRARDAVAAADTALEVLPSMLGRDGPRSYLLVFQNNAEVRATGGLPGAVSVLNAADGGLSVGRQASGGSIAMTSEPVLPLTGAEQAIYGNVLGTFFIDANQTPDFPRTAELMKAHWQGAYPEDAVDGVISVDPVALSYLLAATGPIDVGGVSLTSDNVVEELLHNTYIRLPQPADQDAFFADAARTVFEKLISGGAASPQDVLAALARGGREHRLYVHSFDDAEQQVLDGTPVAGRLVTDPDAAPQIGVYLNDLTGAKMSYYLRNRVSVAATCEAGVQTYAATATLSSQPPADITTQPDYVTGGGLFGTKIGSQAVFLRIYGPVGGDIGRISLDGKKIVTSKPVDDEGRPVATTAIQLDPGQTVVLNWPMTAAKGQRGDTAVAVTPSVEPGTSSSVVAGVC